MEQEEIIRVKINEEEKVCLDLFLLHKKEDVHPKSWILASGNNLEKEIKFLLKQLYKAYEKYQIVNKITSKLGLHIELLDSINPIKFGSEIKVKRDKLKKSCWGLAKETQTSKEDWTKIENNEHFPSCKKLNRIYDLLGNSIFLKINCSRNDLCLKKLILVWNSLYATEEVSIVVLKELLELWKNTFNISEREFDEKKLILLRSIDYLRLNQHASKKTKATIELNETLSKIIGAFCADGNFYPPDMIRWEEEHLSNMQALARWMKDCFRDVKVQKSGRERNSWTIKFRNKVMARYLEIFFNFKPGIKVYTTRAPKIIRNASFNIQKAFTIGAMIFDAGMNNDGTVSFGVVSKKFRDDVASIIQKENIKIYVSNKPNIRNIWYLNSNRLLEKDQKIKLLSYFEKGTIKWQKFKEHIFGFEGSAETFQEAKEILIEHYCKKRKEKFKVGILLETAKYLKIFDVYDMVSKIKAPRVSVVNCLNMFNKFNIISKRYKSRRITYTYNEDVNKWRLPKIFTNPILQ